MDVKKGYVVAKKQENSSLQAPWDPKPLTVTKVKGTKVFSERDGQPKVRSKDKCNVVKLPGREGLQLLTSVMEKIKDSKNKSRDFPGAPP